MMSWKFRLEAFFTRPLNFKLQLNLPIQNNVHPFNSSDHTAFRVINTSGDRNPTIFLLCGLEANMDL